MSDTNPVDQMETDGPEVRDIDRFIAKYSHLFSALGIFTALTVFALNLPLKSVGSFLSGLFLTMTILIWLELWSKFPGEGGHWRLVHFENLITFAIMTLVFYWLVVYVRVWGQMLFLLIWLILMALVAAAVRKWNLFNRIFGTSPGEMKWLRYTLGSVIALVLLVGTLFLASQIHPKTKQVLDELYREFTADTEGQKQNPHISGAFDTGVVDTLRTEADSLARPVPRIFNEGVADSSASN